MKSSRSMSVLLRRLLPGSKWSVPRASSAAYLRRAALNSLNEGIELLQLHPESVQAGLLLWWQRLLLMLVPGIKIRIQIVISENHKFLQPTVQVQFLVLGVLNDTT